MDNNAAKNEEILKRIAQLKSLQPAKIQKTNYVRRNNSLVRVEPQKSTSGEFILKSNNKKLVRKGAPPIVKDLKAARMAQSSLAHLPSVNVDEIMKKYSITKHASESVSSEFITVKNKLVRKAIIISDTNPAANPSSRSTDSSEKRYCRHFSRGNCNDANCKYIHDPEKVIACRQLLQTGKCDGDLAAGTNTCKWNHVLTAKNTPLCLFYMQGRCIAVDSCRYSHNNSTKDALICTDFALSSWCDLGDSCLKKHMSNVCPEFYEKGSCTRNAKCRLKHVNSKAQDFSSKEEDFTLDVSSEEDMDIERDGDFIAFI